MLGQIALLQHSELGYLYIQIHFLLETLIACGKHFDLCKGQCHLVHIFGRTDRAFARHYLADKFLFALHQLIEVGIKSLLGHIAVNLHLWEHVALPFNTSMPLFKVGRTPRTIKVMDCYEPVLHIGNELCNAADRWYIVSLCRNADRTTDSYSGADCQLISRL